jgi:hypothetical protein
VEHVAVTFDHAEPGVKPGRELRDGIKCRQYREVPGLVNLSRPVPLSREEWELESASELRAQMFTQVFCDSWTRSSLDSGTRELLTIAMPAATGAHGEPEKHIGGALKLGGQSSR